MRSCRIGDIAKVQSGYAFKSVDFKPSGVKLLRNTNILPQKIYWDDLVCLEESEFDRFKSFQIHEGDVLISLDRPIISSGFKVARVGNSDVPSLLVQRVGRLIVDQSQVLVEYLYAFLQSPMFIRAVTGHDQSLGVPHISPEQVEGVELPLPDLEKQREICAQVLSHFREVETARAAAATQLLDVSALADAIIFNSVRSATSTPLLSDVLDEVKHGIGADWASHPVHGATRDGLAPAKEPPGKQAQKYKPATPGTVFYNPMRILIGSIAYVDDDDAPGITSPDYVVLRGKPGLVDSRWFYYWLRSPLGAHCILSLARGAVRERMLFNRLAAGEIALPSYAEQQRTSAALRELKPLKRALKSRLSEINRLPQKILAATFEM